MPAYRPQDDRGDADAALAAALGEYAATGDPEPVWPALAAARVLVAVVAELSAEARAAGEKEADAALATLVRPDGASVLPVFTGVAALAAWRAGARPVPVPPGQVFAAARAEGHAGLVVDPGGPVPFVVPDELVATLADGVLPVPRAELARRLAPVLAVPGVTAGWVAPGGELLLTVGERPPDGSAVAGVVARVAGKAVRVRVVAGGPADPLAVPVVAGGAAD